MIDTSPFPSEHAGEETEFHLICVKALSCFSVDCSSGERVVVLFRPV